MQGQYLFAFTAPDESTITCNYCNYMSHYLHLIVCVCVMNIDVHSYSVGYKVNYVSSFFEG